MAVTGDTLIDSVFDGRYRIIRKLGAGGMANVYLAEDQELGRRVAIKILDDRHAADDSFIERFRREAKNAAGLSHPNIVSIYDRGEAEGTYYIAMEYLAGRSLKELIVSRGPTPIRIAIDYTRQTLAALGFAHRNGIVHRDIKPHNVVVDADGRLKVTDFGIARSGASQMTEVGSIIGTAQYLSPEQARGSPVDQRSDVYSVGIVLYEMLTGSVPFTGDTPLEIAMKHLSEVPVPPSEVRDDVPDDLDLVVLRALAKDPDDRYQTAEEMDGDLARIQRGMSVSSETADTATAVLAGAGISGAPTIIAPRPTQVAPPQPPPRMPPAGYYGYEGPPRRSRSIWPWVLVLLLLIGAGFAAWFAYGKITDQLNANKPVAVPYVVGLKQAQAVAKIKDKGLRAELVSGYSNTYPPGTVMSQSIDGGEKTDKGNKVRLTVSKGKPKTTIPNVVGKSQSDAVAALISAHLKVSTFHVYSSETPDTVTAQNPPANSRVFWNTKVRINVSQGEKQIEIPNVVGQPYASARSTLLAAGLGVAKTTVDSNQPANTVVSQSPDAGTRVGTGTTVTLSVSNGATATTPVPDVTNQDEQTAKTLLTGSGFQVKVKTQPVTDPSEQGIVLDQHPGGGTNAPAGSTVTIVVGNYTGTTTSIP
ncbi:MAG TPA: Stk1 family PASTA domain-containing Ser/Thr kinase [Gaiellaceae bacterium]|jgi:serine/threonine-protein kinase|nr:Stk1 family PASTA domain-containing Ser/Thr kinase [Gaiellaceae bacterium]